MKKIILLLSVTFLLIPLWQSCNYGQLSNDLEEAIEDIEIRVALPNFTSFALFQLKDANDNSIINGNCNIELLDGREGLLYDILGNDVLKYGNYTFEHGILQLGIRPSVLPSIDNPVKMTLKFSSEGYEPMIRRVIFSNSGINQCVVKLIEKGNLPLGISEEEETNPTSMSATGAIQNQTPIKSPASNRELSLSSGTQLFDDEGNLITGVTTIESTVRIYDPKENDALEAFPGGLEVLATQANGKEMEGNFVSGGAFQIEMRANGRNIKDFKNGGLEVEIPIAREMINPETGANVKVDDVIQLWSLNEQTGAWKYEGVATIFEYNGELRAKGTFTHLSIWNFDYFDTTSCRTYTTINFTNVSRPFNADLLLHKYGYAKSRYGTISSTNSSISFYNFPQNVTAELRQYTSNDITLSPNSFDLSGKCGQTMKVNVNYGQQVPPITVVMDLDIKCTNEKDIIIKPNWAAWYSQLEETNFFYRNILTIINKGKTTLELTPNKEYAIYLYYEGDRYEMTFLIKGTESNYILQADANFYIPGDDQLDRISIPLEKQSDNRYSFNYEFLVDDCDFLTN